MWLVPQRHTHAHTHARTHTHTHREPSMANPDPNMSSRRPIISSLFKLTFHRFIFFIVLTLVFKVCLTPVFPCRAWRLYSDKPNLIKSSGVFVWDSTAASGCWFYYGTACRPTVHSSCTATISVLKCRSSVLPTTNIKCFRLLIRLLNQLASF